MNGKDHSKWNNFVEIIAKHDFKVGFRNTFPSTSQSETTTEEEIIFFNKEKGLILYVYSCFGQKDVGSATLHGEFKFDGTLTPTQLDILSREHCSYSVERGVQKHFHVLVNSSNFENRLQTLLKAFDFSPKWTADYSVLFVNSTEADEKLRNLILDLGTSIKSLDLGTSIKSLCHASSPGDH